jgi:sterol desaturase/sphingolipid hydroxylase (fatty acid hydroxylase superfamily)
MTAILLTVVIAVIFTEAAAYGIHKVLHSQKIDYLSRNHMIHHLVVYGPSMPQRPSGEYTNSVGDRSSIFGIGMEWLLPIGTILGLIVLGFELLGIETYLLLTFAGTALSWGYFLFGYMHSSMHKRDFWMSKNRFLKNWYLNIRKLHDIHHLYVNDSGKMDCNYGICFFWFDRIFGTYHLKLSGINKQGLEQAHVKYNFIFNQPPQG